MRDSFSYRLRQLREKNHMTQKTLGELCGLGKTSIGQYERGEKVPSLVTLIELADIFDVSVDYLVGRKNKF